LRVTSFGYWRDDRWLVRRPFLEFKAARHEQLFNLTPKLLINIAEELLDAHCPTSEDVTLDGVSAEVGPDTMQPKEVR